MLCATPFDTVNDGQREESFMQAETTEYPLDQAVEVYDKLKAGQVTGRAVLIPDGLAVLWRQRDCVFTVCQEVK